MRWPWAPGKILGVVTLACFLAVAVLARVDAARDPEREWKPSLAELPNPSAVRLPKLVTSAVPVEPVGDSLRIEFGAGLSQPGDAATVTLPEVPSQLMIVLTGSKAEGRLAWNAATGDYSLSTFDAAGRLAAIERYPSRAPRGEVTVSMVLVDEALAVWVGAERIGALGLGPVSSLTLKPADGLGDVRARLGRLR